MAARSNKRALAADDKSVQEPLPASKQRKRDMTDAADPLYVIEATLYSDKKALRNDPMPSDPVEPLRLDIFEDGTSLVSGGNLSTEEGNRWSSDAVRARARELLAYYSSARPVGGADGEHTHGRPGGDDKSRHDKDGRKEGDDEGGDDEDKDDLGEWQDVYAGWRWLEAIDSVAYAGHTWPEQGQREELGACQALLIRRDLMSHAFHHEIMEPTEETGRMGCQLFDRYGRLRPEFKEHPVKKGCGIWGDELNRGDILLLTRIDVQDADRRRGLDRGLVQAILEQTCQKTESFVALARAGDLERGGFGKEYPGATDQDRVDRKEHDEAAFLRSLGFRRVGSSAWFAFAGERSHPSHSLPAADDYDPPIPGPRTAFPDVEPLFDRLRELEADAPCLEWLQSTLDKHAPDAPQWSATDEAGNTLLHAAALSSKPSCVQWLVEARPRLARMRNHEGDTPLEALVAHVEGVRTLLDGKPSSDQFSGFSDASTACLALLRGRVDMGGDERLRLQYGCTCGECLAGVLSPRMRLALRIQAKTEERVLGKDIHRADVFMLSHEDRLAYLPPSARRNMGTNKSMRRGFVNLCFYFATCLEKKRLPTALNVLETLRSEREWPPVTRHYLERGGTVEAVGSMLFQRAMLADTWAGDGSVMEDPSADGFEPLPKCRNDHEYGFVGGMCGYERVSRVRYVSLRNGGEMDIDNDRGERTHRPW